jgi:hypothetical protein
LKYLKASSHDVGWLKNIMGMEVQRGNNEKKGA